MSIVESPEMSSVSLPVEQTKGFAPVLQNRSFRSLWGAQVFSQTAQHAVNFVLIVLIERLVGTSIHQGLIILAFTVPAIIFAPVSGVIIDRWPKKWILAGSNVLRAVASLGYLLVISSAGDPPSSWTLLAIYGIAFFSSTIGQFFNPAEAATIPLLVGKDLLIPANSLFTLTLALSQVIGLIILGPLTVKLIGINAAFVMVAGMYLIASLLVSRLPRDEPMRSQQTAKSGWKRIGAELREGALFVVRRPNILVPMMHLTLIASLVMIMAMLAPGIASRVLNLAPEDAIVVFAPAGVGMLLAAVLLGRWGGRFAKDRLAKLGLLAMASGFAGLGWLAWRFQLSHLHLALDRSVMSLPPAGAALIVATIMLSLYLGFSMAGVNIISQSALQERSPDRLRGRVFAVQFMLNNLVGIPPMLAIGGLADLVGIPPILVGVGLIIMGVYAATITIERRAHPLPGIELSRLVDDPEPRPAADGRKESDSDPKPPAIPPRSPGHPASAAPGGQVD
jgi:MFS family permease